MSLVSIPRKVSVDQNGQPRVAAVWQFFQAGTDTAIPTYTTAAMDVEHPATTITPVGGVPSGSNGYFPAVYVNEALYPTHKQKIIDANGLTTFTEDAIPTLGITASSVGALLYPLSDLEDAALLELADLDSTMPWGDLRRYGALGDGSTNDSAALASAHATGHRILGGGPEFTYSVTSVTTLTKSFDFDGQGCTIKPTGNTACFSRNTGNAWAAQTTISSGATIGSRSFVVASATGIAVGQWCRVYSDDQPTNDASVFPSHWAKVTNVSGTTIKIDSPFEIGQQGTVTAEFYSTASIYPTLKIKNVTFDGSASTYNAATGQAVRAYWFENVDVDVNFINWDNNASLTNALEIAQCVDVRARVRCVDGSSQFHMIDIQDCRTAHLIDSICEGAHFGMTITRCESALMQGNTLRGRKKMEYDESLTSSSTRGLKMYGCGTARMFNNYACDYESPLKVECCHQFDVSHNTVRNAGLANDPTTLAINIGNQVDGDITTNGRACFNTVINCGGVGIGVTSSTTATVEGRCIIMGNQVKGVQSHGIYCLAPNSQIIGNRVENWNLVANVAYFAIYTNDGATVTGNRFRHSTDATSICFNIDGTVGFKYVFRDNVCETANPLFDVRVLYADAVAERFVSNRGQSSITAAATSRVITHLLIATPEITDIVITPTNSPTNDPGHMWVDTITSTQFTVNCRAVPGVSTATFGWRVDIRMPYTS